MKTVRLQDVAQYKNSDKWISEEVSGRLLLSSITFVSFNKEFIKVFWDQLLLWTLKIEISQNVSFSNDYIINTINIEKLKQNFPFAKQCLIGDGEVVMKCIMKTPNMIKQVQKAMDNGMSETKIIIESFQKRDDALFTSDKSTIELDTEV